MTNQFDKITFKLLLATTIREKDDSYIVSEIFTRFPSIQELLDVTEEELLSIKGIGRGKAQQIIAALNLARLNPSTAEERFAIRSPQDAFTYLKDMQYLTREEFICLGLNTKNEILFRQTIFTGSLNASIVHPRKTFLPLIKRSCASAIVAHNHPSGQPAPSREDIEVMKRLAEVGRIVGIEVLDHIIIGHEKYVSLKEKGYL
ncbi:DNA repair protein RadC [Bacillus anthracis]|uniref:RadC family protein n=1 Tax=Bacillus anthracis TaxID=1392 RepID=UPI00283C890E|nr:DNA repair protein RadC [Bacillus anthracis]MDR4408951.1 DNA repair protein RadC [Bacillus anthracis]HDR8319254.1 DNA repair protein RadC [Bacillus cereus]HDR8326627.1 DNA repair protein RadC [Bacillus cereus]HDR8332508.1 DNA repair protein RadC [Bacillus cereus]